MAFDHDEDVDKLNEQHDISEVSTGMSTESESGESGDEKRTLWQNVKKYRKVVWITMGMTSEWHCPNSSFRAS